MNTQTVVIKPEHHEAIKAHIVDALRKTGHVAEGALAIVAEVALGAVVVGALATQGGGGAFAE